MRPFLDLYCCRDCDKRRGKTNLKMPKMTLYPKKRRRYKGNWKWGYLNAHFWIDIYAVPSIKIWEFMVECAFRIDIYAMPSINILNVYFMIDIYAMPPYNALNKPFKGAFRIDIYTMPYINIYILGGECTSIQLCTMQLCSYAAMQTAAMQLCSQQKEKNAWQQIIYTWQQTHW